MATKVTWEWLNDDNQTWVPYADDVCAELERNHSNGVNSVDLSQSFHNLPYTVDLKKMEQSRNDTGRTRSIRRSPTSAAAGRPSRLWN